MAKWFLLMPVLVLAWSSAQAEDANIRLLLPEDAPVWVGEPIRFQIELAVKGQFSGPTIFDLPKINDAILMQDGDRPVLGSDTIAGEAWTTQLHGFTLFVQKGGSAVVPPVTARFGLRSRFDAPQQSMQLQSDSFQRLINAPPGVVPGTLVAAVIGFEALEEWELEDADSLRQGDAVRRVIHASAKDYPAMLLPEPVFEAVSGLAIYPDEPEISDRVERGDWEAKRSDSVVYVFEEAGQFELPAITLRWWDPQAEAWQEQSFAARQFEVSASGLGTGDAGDHGAAEPVASKALWLIMAGVLVIASLSCWLLRHRISSLFGKWRQRDAARLAKLMDVIRQGTAAETYEACRKFLQELPGPQVAAATAALHPHILALQEVIIGNNQDFDRQALAKAIGDVQAGKRRLGVQQDSDLPATLNPVKYGPTT